MKKLFSVFLSLFLMAAMCLPAFCEDEVFSDETVAYYKSLGLEGTTLNVYNWGEYIDDEDLDVVSQFERLTGCNINYTTFESNENMYSKLSGGGVSYDIVIPSDYMVEKLMNDGMLEKLDFGNIPNYEKYFDAEDYGYLVSDEVNGEKVSEYAVIYNVGTTILIYNTKYVKEKPDSWSVLWDEQYKGKVLMFNNPRDAFAIAQAYLGQDFNTTDPADWDKAAELLRQQREKVSPSYVMDEIFNKMESGDYYLGVYYAGDYELMKENNDDLDFAFPKEGVNTFYDAMCIPTSTQNKKGAEAFINFMLEPEVALANAEYIYYATANKAVIDSGEFSLADSEAVYPDPDSITVQQFHNLPNDTLQYMNTLWMKVKGENNAQGIYITFFAVLAVIVLIIVLTVLHKRKMKKYYNV
ncbi:MAG: spermidine/putrescine ABC transporter substrate-binding protein [Ruminococcaceae bacterium]|nr:spermidine/putrescine ABC transporter substrate-binding protein [Oscillospiraceae bacterium]